MSLNVVVRMVERLKPGESIEITGRLLDDTPSRELVLGYLWSPADQVLEKIVGSSYEFQIQEGIFTRSITFHRLEKPLTDGRRSYVCPDKRRHYTKGIDGIWVPKNA